MEKILQILLHCHCAKISPLRYTFCALNGTEYIVARTRRMHRWWYAAKFLSILMGNKTEKFMQISSKIKCEYFHINSELWSIFLWCSEDIDSCKWMHCFILIRLVSLSIIFKSIYFEGKKLKRILCFDQLITSQDPWNANFRWKLCLNAFLSNITQNISTLHFFRWKKVSRKRLVQIQISRLFSFSSACEIEREGVDSAVNQCHSPLSNWII